MQAATSPIHGATPVGPSVSPSTAATIPFSSSLDPSHQHHPSSQPHPSGSSIQNNALRFVANHHRQHNPNDPKLRANPSFKSRRSSLLGSVLKSKSKGDSRKLANTLASARAPPHPIAPKPRVSSPSSHHHHTKSLPTSTSNASVTGHTSSLNLATSPTRTHQLTHQNPSGIHTSTSDAHAEHPHSISHDAKPHLVHLGDSPPTASFPSPTDLPEGSTSTCSSANAKAISLASSSAPLTSLSMDAPFLPTSAPQLSGQAASQHLSGASPAVDAVTADSSPPRPTDAFQTLASQSRFEMQEQGDSAPSSPIPAGTASSRATLTSSHASPTTTTIPAPQASLPIITRTIVPDDSNHIPSQHLSTSPGKTINADLNVVSPPSASPSYPSTAPSNCGTLEQSLDPAPQRLSQSTSAFVTSPQRFSSLARKSAARLTLDTDVQSPAELPRGLARDINQELDSPTSPEMIGARTERRMSMLDFLTADPAVDTSPQLALASLSAEDLPRSLQPASRTGLRSNVLLPPSIPLVQASHQLRLEAAAARGGGKALQPRKIDLCDHVRVGVEPLIDRLTMFGSMQSSSNYSLAGTVVVEVPKLNVPRLSAAAAVARDGSTSDHPSVHVEALTVRFVGYSVYVDATGRFNSIRLAEISQELLQPQGFSCPVEMVETGESPTSPDDSTANAANRDASQQTLKYETEFDLSIPGWLPASQRSRFGATFYCVQATAIVEGQAILSALSGFDAFGGDGWQSPTSSLNLARSLESELREAADGKSAAERKDGTRSPPASTVKSKTKNTWLNKTAKQLQLRSSKKSTGTEAEQSSSISNSRRGSGSKDVVPASVEQDPLFSKTTEASNQLLPTGQHSIRSECLSILVRRCRDVVPVPVARLARLATASQVMRADGTTPSLSQSMLALARLQDTSDAAAAHPDGSSGSSGSEATASARSHLPTSVSAPMSLAAHAENRQSETARVSVPPANSSIDEAATLSPEGNADAAMSEAPSALAPSPRIDANPRGWGQDPASAASERHSALGAEREIVPRAPSAFDAPRDPAKLAAATSGMTPSATLPNLPSSMSRASSLFDSRFGNANSPPRTSSRSASAGRSSAPLRHFVHRPTLHLPPVLGLTPDKDAAGGLSFSLTLSLPSHVHVAGPKSDLLSFGVQIDLGRTQGWDALKKWGGLRLKDMELVCLQTERHSSMPSRSFCAAFPVPPPPNKVDAADLPVVTTSRKTPSVSNDTQQLAAEIRLRQSYDRSLVLGHIELANQGKAPHPIEHNVERIRTTIVGPPPFALKKRCQEVGKEDGDKSRKGKAKININSGNQADRPGGFSRSPSRGSPAGSGTNTPDGSSTGGGISGLRAAFAPAAQVNSGSRMSVMQPRPRALARSNNSSSSSLRQAFQGTDGSGAMQPAPRPSTAGAALASGSSPNGPSRSRRPIPFDLGSASETVTTRRDISASGLDADGADPNMPFADAADSPSQPGSQISRSTARTNSDGPAPLYALEGETQRRITGDGATTRMGVSSSVTTRSSGRPAAAPRRSRFENAISRLSTFASSMLEQPHEVPAAGGSTHDPRASANAPANANGAAAASLRASYAFSGDDGQGVDLTKGRVRMTINLPLVSSDLDAARKAGSAQLISDFESPYVRVRHKLKVKLGFGLKSNVALGEDGEDWAQTLVMCVPVRFTEAPPKEVQEQFGPVRIVPGNAQTAAPVDPLAGDQSRAAECALATGQGSNEARSSTGTGLPETFAEPLLPAYAQLFREDGSRLADEGEDLPRYPGRMSVVGEIDEDPAPDTGVVDDGHGAMAAANLQASNVLSTVDEAHVSGSSASDLSPVSTMPGNGPHSVFSTELPRDQAATMSRLSNRASVPMLMDRTTSLPGNRLLTRTTSSSVFGLRTSPSHPVLPGSSQSATSSPYVETSSNTAVTKSRVGSSAFDPLPARPGMRRRSATTASLVTFSRITPAEVLDEALVTSALDDEEDRMDGMQPSHTLDSLTGRPRRGLGGGMDGSGQDDDDEAEEEELDVEDEDDLDGVDSPEVDSEAGHGMMGMRIHSNGGLSGSEGDGETVDVEVGRAL
ncbi:uncharacterized protein UTRI_05490_B [Ustilago trichophora]|uniref:Uncharacterized protein n=1 Tax=Ustilago trichophora TaxID=86804 RepID=A0A5C3EK85_9BASI|nr:uncharacterized protein UTRI_05490_B [Ustilago trichophora]